MYKLPLTTGAELMIDGLVIQVSYCWSCYTVVEEAKSLAELHMPCATVFMGVTEPYNVTSRLEAHR